MADSDTHSTDSMKHARCVHEACAHCAQWKNLEGTRPRERFVLRTALGPVDENLHYVKGNARIVLHGVIEADLLLDTGATRTVISGGIAHELGLPVHGKPVEVRLGGGETGWFVPAEVYVAIGTNWRKVRCLVPCPIDAGECSGNLLGMEGLLDRHIFCLADDELHLFRRQGQESVEKGEWLRARHHSELGEPRFPRCLSPFSSGS